MTVDVHAGVGGVGEDVVVGGPELRDVALQRATINMDDPEGSEGPAEEGTLLTAVMRGGSITGISLTSLRYEP